MCLTIIFPENILNCLILCFKVLVYYFNMQCKTVGTTVEATEYLEGNALRNRVECQTQYICHNEGLVQSLTSILLRCPFRIISFRQEGFLEARPFPHHKIIVTMFLIIYFTIYTVLNILCYVISRLCASR